jgi:proline dehydrogenase
MLTMSVVRATVFRLATSAAIEHAVRVVPAAERQAWRAASRYVAGSTVGDAWRVAGELHGRGIPSSIDQFGEAVTDEGTAAQVVADYLRVAADLNAAPEDVWLSVDLSHLGLDIDRQRCAEHLAAIAAALPPGRRIQVGAEDYDRADAVLRCILAVAEGEAGPRARVRGGAADRLGATVQANLNRSGVDLDRLVAAGVHIRLVKGAYVEPPDRALPYGEPTDLAYLRLAHRLADAGAQFSLATHDGVIRESLLTALGPRPVEHLLGVRPDVLDELVARGVPVRVYVPYGHNWFRYWMRRLAESRGTS